MDELPRDVREALDSAFGVGRYRAASRVTGDAELSLIIECEQRPNRMFVATVSRPAHIDRIENEWRKLAAEAIERWT